MLGIPFRWGHDGAYAWVMAHLDICPGNTTKEVSVLKHYVIASGRGKQKGAGISLITAMSAAQAHEFAAVDFRKKAGLASSVHISTATLAECDTEFEARDFIDRLFELMKEQDEACNGSTGKSEQNG